MTRTAVRPQRGTTLPELLLGVAVIASTLALGLPALGAVLERQQVRAASSAMAATLAAARMAAIGHGQRAVVCPSRAGIRCDPGSRWESGWIVFLDADRDGAPDPGTGLLRRHDALGGRVAVTTSSGRPRVLFHPDGRAGGANVTIRICGTTGRPGRALVLNHSGRVRSDAAQRCD